MPSRTAIPAAIPPPSSSAAAALLRNGFSRHSTGGGVGAVADSLAPLAPQPPSSPPRPPLPTPAALAPPAPSSPGSRFDTAAFEARYEELTLRIVSSKGRSGPLSSRELRLAPNDLVAGRYVVLDFLGAAAFSTAVQALDTKSGVLVCLKVIKNCKDYFDQALDEVRMLRAVAAAEDESAAAAAASANANNSGGVGGASSSPSSPSPSSSAVAGSGIVRLLDFFYYREHLFLVTELLRANLYDVVRACKRAAAAAEAAAAAAAEVAEAAELEAAAARGEEGGEAYPPPPPPLSLPPPPPPPPYYFTLPRVQSIARQLLRSLAFLHDRLGIVHCDVKPENVLLKSAAAATVRLIDLGSACFATDPPSSYVQSRPYRAPEVVLGLPYDGRIDVWSTGCLVAELLSGGRPLFASDSAAGLLARVQGILLKGLPLPERMRAEGRHTSRFYCYCCSSSSGNGCGGGSGGNGTGNGASPPLPRSGSLSGGGEAANAHFSSSSPSALPSLIYERSARSGRLTVLRPKRSSLAARVPGADAGALSFLEKVLAVDPGSRPSAEEALKHPWLAFDYDSGMTMTTTSMTTTPTSPPQGQHGQQAQTTPPPEPLALLD